MIDDKKWGSDERDLLYEVYTCAVLIPVKYNLPTGQRRHAFAEQYPWTPSTVLKGVVLTSNSAHVLHGPFMSQCVLCESCRINFSYKPEGMQAVEKHGIGSWREISEQYLPKWDDQAIRIKASRLMGSQSLARYIGWKGNRYAHAGTQLGNIVGLPLVAPGRVVFTLGISEHQSPMGC